MQAMWESCAARCCKPLESRLGAYPNLAQEKACEMIVVCELDLQMELTGPERRPPQCRQAKATSVAQCSKAEPAQSVEGKGETPEDLAGFVIGRGAGQRGAQHEGRPAPTGGAQRTSAAVGAFVDQQTSIGLRDQACMAKVARRISCGGHHPSRMCLELV